MMSIIGNKLASLHELTKQNKYRRAVPSAKSHKISILFQKVCMGWKLSPIINRRGVGIRMSWVEKNRKSN